MISRSLPHIARQLYCTCDKKGKSFSVFVPDPKLPECILTQKIAEHLDPLNFAWADVAAWRWSHLQHISILESIALLAVVRFISRDSDFHGFRHIVGVDNAAPVGAATKGRSSCHILNQTLKRISVLLLSTFSLYTIPYFPTKQNPSDKASRDPNKPEPDHFLRFDYDASSKPSTGSSNYRRRAST